MLHTEPFLSGQIDIAIPTVTQVMSWLFHTTDFIRQSLPPGERAVSHKDYLLRGNRMRKNFKSQVFIYVLYRKGNKVGGRDSSVGIAIRYGLDGPVIESRWERDFPHPSRPALGYNGYRVFPGGKAAGAWC